MLLQLFARPPPFRQRRLQSAPRHLPRLRIPGKNGRGQLCFRFEARTGGALVLGKKSHTLGATRKRHTEELPNALSHLPYHRVVDHDALR